MRKLPTRAVKTKNSVSDENARDGKKSKINKSPVTKAQKNVRVRSTRKALADKTNSGSDHNQSPSPVKDTQPIKRPRRTPAVPSRFDDHETGFSKPKIKSHFSSTPLIKSQNKTGKGLSTTAKKLLEKTPFVSPIERNAVVSKNSPAVVNNLKNVPRNKVTKTESAATRALRFNENDDKKQMNEKASTINTSLTQKGNKSPKKVTLPIYKSKLINHNTSELDVSNKEALYEFQYDPKDEPPPTAIKKKKIKRVKKAGNPVKRKPKKLSDSLSEEAMKLLLADLNKIRNAKLFNRLQAIKKAKNAPNPKEITENSPDKQTVQNVNNIERLQTSNDGNKQKENNTELFKRLQALKKAKNTEKEIHSNQNVENIADDNREHNDNHVHFEDDFVMDDGEEMQVDEPNSNPNLSENNSSDVRFSNAPIASSSFNRSNFEKPPGSPWRVDLDMDTKKWRYNFYVKQSMTPAYERDTFHVFGLDSKDDERYLAAQSRTSVQDEQKSKDDSGLKQTSILSYFRDNLTNKSPKKKKAKPIQTVQYNFDEPREQTKDDGVQNNSSDAATEKQKDSPAVDNCFGFEFEEDQENVSPRKVKSLKSKPKAVLRSLTNKRKILSELKKNMGPSRSTGKELRSVVRQKERNVDDTTVNETVEITNNDATERQTTIESSSENSDDNNATENTTRNDSVAENTVALFEEPLQVELVHAEKPARKSYERPKRQPVRFKETEVYADTDHHSESDSESPVQEKLVKKKKKKPRTLSKKEEKEMEVWVAGFNSMIEEAEEFDLCIE